MTMSRLFSLDILRDSLNCDFDVACHGMYLHRYPKKSTLTPVSVENYLCRLFGFGNA